MVSASRAFYETFKVSRDETIGAHLYELGDRQWDIPELRHLLDDVIPRSTAVVGYEVEREFPGLGRKTMLVSAHKLFHPDNISRTLLLSIVDATKRRARETERELLLGELRHRMKNLLAMVQAIARQISAESTSAKKYRDAFLGRFTALVAAHDLAFSGDGEVTLKTLVEQTLEPFSCNPESIRIEEGPSIRLASREVVSLNLILHELATNTIKYGALSSPNGRVRVGWELTEADARSIRLEWQESGGPPVNLPTNAGFGTHLIDFTARYELGGRAELNYAPTGLQAEIVFTLSSIS